jgi:ABC-2 type transport system ATP-binding protein
MEQAVLQTQGLSKVYGALRAVDTVSLTVNKGDIYGFVGLNGSGKTTFIRMITSLIRPSSGNFSLFGEAGRRPEHLKRISSMVETPSIYLNLSAWENLQVQARVAGIERHKINETADGLLKLVNLTYTAKKKAKQFSLGMRQRLGIAMALCGDPEFMLLDEPTNGLDPEGIIEIRELLQRLNRTRGITILISSHILSELGKMATRYGFIHHGRMIRETSAAELHEASKNVLYIETDNVETAQKAFAAKNIQHTARENWVEVMGGLTVSDAFRILEPAGVNILGAQNRADDLEGYFMNLLGGATHEGR